jgi:hypothetical protein
VVSKDATIYFPFKFPINKYGKLSHGCLAFPIVVYQLNLPLLEKIAVGGGGDGIEEFV